MTQVIEGYMFWTSGCEHGPTVMVKSDDNWDQPLYKRLKDASWCDCEFSCFTGDDNYCKTEVFKDVEFELVPGTKYRITVEELT